MGAKYYRNHKSLKHAALYIIRQVLDHGQSEGWVGSIEEFDTVEKLCEPFGVVYTDDFLGIWKLKKRQKKNQVVIYH